MLLLHDALQVLCQKHVVLSLFFFWWQVRCAKLLQQSLVTQDRPIKAHFLRKTFVERTWTFMMFIEVIRSEQVQGEISRLFACQPTRAFCNFHLTRKAAVFSCSSQAFTPSGASTLLLNLTVPQCNFCCFQTANRGGSPRSLISLA